MVWVYSKNFGCLLAFVFASHLWWRLLEGQVLEWELLGHDAERLVIEAFAGSTPSQAHLDGKLRLSVRARYSFD
jgi:hypothetical protein